jgi:hypothetical protein
MSNIKINIAPDKALGYFSITWPKGKWLALTAAFEAIVDLDDRRFAQSVGYLKEVISRLKRICENNVEESFTMREPGECTMTKANVCFNDVILEELIDHEKLTLLKEFYGNMDRQLIDTDEFFQDHIEMLSKSDVDMDKEMYINLTQKKPWERVLSDAISQEKERKPPNPEHQRDHDLWSFRIMKGEVLIFPCQLNLLGDGHPTGPYWDIEDMEKINHMISEIWKMEIVQADPESQDFKHAEHIFHIGLGFNQTTRQLTHCPVDHDLWGLSDGQGHVLKGKCDFELKPYINEFLELNQM